MKHPPIEALKQCENGHCALCRLQVQMKHPPIEALKQPDRQSTTSRHEVQMKHPPIEALKRLGIPHHEFMV